MEVKGRWWWPLLWQGLWHHHRPLQARGGAVSGPAGGDDGGVQKEAQAEAEAPEVPGAGGGKEDPGSAAGQSLTSHHSGNIWTILICSRTKVWWSYSRTRISRRGNMQNLYYRSHLL